MIRKKVWVNKWQKNNNLLLMEVKHSSKALCSAVKIIRLLQLDEKMIQLIIFIYQKKKIKSRMKLKKIPFIRGIVALIESAGIGSRHLNIFK